MKLLCFIFGHAWQWYYTKDLGADLELYYQCALCEKKTVRIMADSFEDEARL